MNRYTVISYRPYDYTDPDADHLLRGLGTELSYIVDAETPDEAVTKRQLSGPEVVVLEHFGDRLEVVAKYSIDTRIVRDRKRAY
jgi:hypothetical protein